MKATKLMLTACIAALALVSCNKEEGAPEINNRLKTVEVSLKNVAITSSRGLAGTKITQNTPVKVNNFKIFLTDAEGNEYTAKTRNGSADAQTWWSTADLTTNATNAEFHYVDPKCTKVIAVANIPNDMTYAEYKALAPLQIADQQDAQNLTLWDSKDLQNANREHNDLNDDGTTYVSDVYTATLTLRPRVSRFEVDGFSVEFNETPKYSKIEITDIAFQNYYPLTNLVTGVESGDIVNHMTPLTNQSVVFNWFNDATKAAAWYWDPFTTPIEINSANADPVTHITVADTPNPLAYHIFSCNTTPVMVIKLLADNQPAYLYSTGFYKNVEGTATKIENFEEGKIYRMSAAGEVSGDGSIPFHEEDIDPMDRCLEITVDVVDWTVDLVYPEFN